MGISALYRWRGCARHDRKRVVPLVIVLFCGRWRAGVGAFVVNNATTSLCSELGVGKSERETSEVCFLFRLCFKACSFLAGE